jgi:uncharacterized damage-inducible protein DinB
MRKSHLSRYASHYRAGANSARIAGQEDAMLTDRFREMAAYNRWANQRMYADAAMLDDTVRKRPLGLFFSSIHGTLNHLLVADYIWMRRFTGEGPRRF